MSKVVGYIVALNNTKPKFLTYEQASLIVAQQSAKMFVVTDFSSITDAIACPDINCCGFIVQDIFKDNELRCNECGK